MYASATRAASGICSEATSSRASWCPRSGDSSAASHNFELDETSEVLDDIEVDSSSTRRGTARAV